MSTRAKLAALRPRIEAVTIPGIDEPVHVRCMTGAERAALVARRRAADSLTDADIVILGVCDAAGVRLYKDTDLDELNLMPGDVLQQLAAAVAKVSGLTDEAKDTAAKN